LELKLDLRSEDISTSRFGNN